MSKIIVLLHKGDLKVQHYKRKSTIILNPFKNPSKSLPIKTSHRLHTNTLPNPYASQRASEGFTYLSIIFILKGITMNIINFFGTTIERSEPATTLQPTPNTEQWVLDVLEGVDID